MILKNASQYRKPPVKRTQVSFFDDTGREFSQRPELGDGRETQIRRDTDTISDLSITLYDIDYSIKAFIEQTIQPRVDESGQWIEVPVVYANAEKWKSIQSDGYLRDGKGRVLTPLIVFRRSLVAVDDALRKNRVLPVEGSHYLMQRRHSNLNRYDKFSLLNGEQPSNEYYMVVVPEYVNIEYEFVIWTQYQSQLNDLIQYFAYWQGKAFGEENYYKFTSKIDSFPIEVVNNTGEDRLVRSTFTMSTRGYLIPKETTKENLMKRVVSVRKIEFGAETVTGFDNPTKDSSATYLGPRYIDRGDVQNDVARSMPGIKTVNIFKGDDWA